MSFSTRPIAVLGCATGADGGRAVRATTLQILPSASIRPIFKKQQDATPGDVMIDAGEQGRPEKLKKSSWWWPGVVASSLAGAAVVAFRGCWHGKMSWPVGVQGYSYQVCLNCGAMRLFDEKTFRAYGPFRYGLNELIAWERSTKPKSQPVADLRRPPS